MVNRNTCIQSKHAGMAGNWPTGVFSWKVGLGVTDDPPLETVSSCLAKVRRKIGVERIQTQHLREK